MKAAWDASNTRKVGEFSGRIIAVVLLMLVASTGVARGQSCQIPTQASGTAAKNFYDLYQVASEMLSNPGGEYEPGQNPDFCYPSQMQANWANFMAQKKKEPLSPQETAQFLACVPHLNAAIDKAERGYRIQYAQEQAEKKGGKPSPGALAEAANLHSEAQSEFAQCNAEALQLAQSETGKAAPPSEPIPGQAKTTDAGDATGASPGNVISGNTSAGDDNGGAPVPGSVEEAAQPGSIDWTPALQPLFKYLGHEWQTHIDPNWAPDEAGNTLTLKLLPGEKPEVVSTTGERASTLNNMMQASGVPTVQFPAGSTLRSVEVSPQFTVKYGISGGQNRARKKYYERGGKFKVYTAG